MDLTAAGRFPAAAALALTLPEGQSAAALASVFALWTQAAPHEAADAALALTDPAARDHAWQTVVATWSAAAPASLAAHSLTLPENFAPARRHALDAAVGHWLALDAPAAMDWVGRLPSGPATDGAVALVAQQPDLLHTQPELALDWAESIQDPPLRSRTLGRVVRAWRDSTPAALAAAEHYARTSPDLLPSEREDILVGERFTAHP